MQLGWDKVWDRATFRVALDGVGGVEGRVQQSSAGIKEAFRNELGQQHSSFGLVSFGEEHVS